MMGKQLMIKKYIRLTFSIYGKADCFHISKDTVRMLGYPNYICLKIKNNNALVILPSEAKEVMSFIIPKNLFSSSSGQFRVTSKSFVTEILTQNNLSKDKTYLISGKYSEKENAVFFNINNAKIFHNFKNKN